jgi:hypothetical protein
MYFSKLLNNIIKNSITFTYKKNNNSNIRQKHILYQLLQDKNNKNNLYRLPPIYNKNILSNTLKLQYKNNNKINDIKVNNTKINDTKIIDIKLIDNRSIIELSDSDNTNIKNTNTYNYIKIIIISSITGLISYSGLYVYLFINNISSFFCL